MSQRYALVVTTDMLEELKHSSEYWKDRAIKAETERDRLRAANNYLREKNQELRATLGWLETPGKEER